MNALTYLRFISQEFVVSSWGESKWTGVLNYMQVILVVKVNMPISLL